MLQLRDDATTYRTLEEQLTTLSSGSVQVLGASIEERSDPEEDYVLVSLRLSAPDGDTWPLDDFYVIRRNARKMATEALPDRGVQLSYDLDEPRQLEDEGATELGGRSSGPDLR